MNLGIRLWPALSTVCGLLFRATTKVEAQAPPFPRITATAESLSLPAPLVIGVGAPGGGMMPFKFGGVSQISGNVDFIVVSPSSGIAPSITLAALNPSVVPYLPPGEYFLVVNFVDTNGKVFWTQQIDLLLTEPPPPGVSTVVNAATLQPAISPGTITTIFGTNLSTPPISATFNDAGLLPTVLGNTTVTFNGVAAPLLYVSNTQINAVVPYSVAGAKSVDVVVKRTYDVRYVSAAVPVPLADTSPGIFALGQNGSGQGAILNVDCTNPYIVSVNSVSNPAPAGCPMTIFGTGAGLWDHVYANGSVFYGNIDTHLATAAAPVSLTIGGQAAQVLYSGPASGQVSGGLQVNVIVPEGIGYGPQPIVLTVGSNNNSQQQVTVAIK